MRRARAHGLLAFVCGAAMLHASGCKKRQERVDEGPRPAADDEALVSLPAAGARDDAGALDPAEQRVVIDQISVKTVDPEQPRPIYPRLIAQELGRALRDSGWFYATAGQLPAGKAARHADIEVIVTYDVLEQPPGRRDVVAAVESRVRWADRSPEHSTDLAPAENLVAERPVPAGEADLDRLVAGHVGAAVMKAGEGLVAKEAVRSGAPEEVIRALEATDPDMVMFALEVIAERKLEPARDAVLRLLERDGPVRLRAVGVLVALGDREVVDPMVKKARFDDLDMMRAVVEAASVLGGEDARQYLEFVASGHPDDAVRQHASEALARLPAER